MKTKTLNIPAALHALLKKEAVDRGMGLCEYIVSILEARTNSVRK